MRRGRARGKREIGEVGEREGEGRGRGGGDRGSGREEGGWGEGEIGEVGEREGEGRGASALLMVSVLCVCV